jgi:hypothetical protein
MKHFGAGRVHDMVLVWLVHLYWCNLSPKAQINLPMATFPNDNLNVSYMYFATTSVSAYNV